MKTSILKIIVLFCVACLPHTTHAATHPAKTILVFGDSLSAGYGLAVAESWPALLQNALKRSRSKWQVVNASITGETTVGGLQRIGKALMLYRPALVVVELGVNDGLRGASTADIESNLNNIVESVEHEQLKVLLVGMKLPANERDVYTQQFEKIYSRVAEKHSITLLPFLLEGVSQQQFQGDRLHPDATAQPIIMRNVLEVLQPLLR